MQFGIDIECRYAISMRFDNGWAINLALNGDNRTYSVVIVPIFLDDLIQGDDQRAAYNEYRKEKYSAENMLRRGDYIPRLKITSDNEILDLITKVANRPTEPHLAKVGQDIIKAVKS